MKNIKETVKEKYSNIALEANNLDVVSCCEPSCCDTKNYSYIGEDGYEKMEGYVKEADLNLGCGLPTQFAKIKPGDTVVDLGSGAGNDCFIARKEAGETGEIIGVDFSEAMIDLARKNVKMRGFENVKFVHGDIETLPLESNTADVVVSNCVLNLVPNKEQAYLETFRILKPGGHFSISDVVVEGDLPKALQEDAEMYVGCVAGAMPKNLYLDIIQKAGFKEVTIQKQRAIDIPPAVLEKHLTADEIAKFNKEIGIYSLSVFGKKPS